MRVAPTSFTRPSNTTAYAAGDLIANSATAGSVVLPAFTLPAGAGFLMRRFKLWKSDVTLTLAQFRVHFWKSGPTFTNGDNGVLNNGGALLATGVADYFGSLEMAAVMDRSLTDGAVGWCVPATGFGAEIILSTPASDPTISWAVEALAAYVPASAEVFSGQPELLEL
jgi:hypothetical protein